MYPRNRGRFIKVSYEAADFHTLVIIIRKNYECRLSGRSSAEKIQKKKIRSYPHMLKSRIAELLSSTILKTDHIYRMDRRI